MISLFKNILVPVDFSLNTEVAVRQAIELACTSGSTIHLLHVIKPKSIWSVIPAGNESVYSGSKDYQVKGVMMKLQEWKHTIEETIPNSNVEIYILEGAIQDNIKNTAKQMSPDLIIIGRKSNSIFFTFFNSVYPNSLAKSTDCPVMTVMKGSLNAKIKIIVLPVGCFIPKRKIELVVEFAKKYRAKIQLVALQNRNGARDAEKNALLKTYWILRTVLTNPIEYFVLKSNNLPKATLKYAVNIGADMILVNPGTETKISTLTGRQISDLLESSSKLKILVVEPYHNK